MKIYGQMASIMPYEILAWEKLFWFLKFLIPKLKIKDKDADEIDALLNAVDLSSYGLERIKLNHAIELDDSETQLDPANPNPRGAHGGEQQKDPWIRSSRPSTNAGSKAGTSLPKNSA